MAELQVQYFEDAAYMKPNPAGVYWRCGAPTENGGDSTAIARSFVRWKMFWGTSSIRIVAHDKTSARKGEPTKKEMDDNKDFWELPDWARSFTIEGKRDPGAYIAVTHLLAGK